MPEHNDFYTPAHIDEQVDALLQARDMPERDQRLADDLRAMLEYEHENARSLHTVLQKLLEDTSEQPTKKIIPISEKQSQGRPVVMPQSPHPTKKRQAHSMLRVWSTLAAVLVIAVLFGSMLLILNAVHQPKGGSSNANHSNPTTIPTPTLPEGQVIYTSGKVSITMPIAWSPDGKRVATALDHTTVESWDVHTGKNVVTYPVALNSTAPGALTTNYVTNVAWSPDGSKLLVAESHTIYLFNAITAQLIRTFQPATSMAVHTPATSPLTLTRGTGQQRPFSATLPLSGTDIFGNAVWSPNGRYIAAMYDTGGWYSTQGVIDIWDVASGTPVTTLSSFTSNGVSVSWSSQENRLAALGYDNTVPTVKIWNTDSWMITNQYPQTTAFDWSPTGTQMALIGTDKTGQGAGSVSIVDIASGKTVRQFTDPQAIGAQAIHWSPDGSRLALENGKITIWSATNGALLYTFPQKGAYEATWSPDSKYIGCGQTQSTINGKKREYSMLILIWVA